MHSSTDARRDHATRFRVYERREPDDAASDVRRPVLTLTSEQRRRLGLAPADAHAQLAGARAQRSGRAFEAEIENANAFYEERGVAVVYRHFPTVEGWGRTLRVTGRGPADFSGVMRLEEGRSIAVAFDCKVITGEASYAHAERDRHQVESLLRFSAAGGLAFLLLHCREMNRVWLLDDLDALRRRERVVVRRRRGGLVEHLLPVLEPSPVEDVARKLRPGWDYHHLAALMHAAALVAAGGTAQARHHARRTRGARAALGCNRPCRR